VMLPRRRVLLMAANFTPISLLSCNKSRKKQQQQQQQTPKSHSRHSSHV
jgi:hypothetical protein